MALAVVAAMGAFVWILSFVAFGTKVREYGVGIDGPVRWLPREARDITYVRTGLIRAAEFTISEEAFVDWANGLDLQVRPLGAGGSGRGTVPRANEFLLQTGAVKIPPYSDDLDEAGWRAAFLWRTAEFAPGDLYYEKINPNSGGTQLGFSRSQSRAYLFHANR